MNTRENSAVHANVGGKHLIFNLGDEEYGLHVLRVQEIIGLIPTTPLPGSQRHLKGMINLRGKVVPVLCMRSRLGLPPVEANQQNVYIVVEGSHGEPIGLAVDRVREVTQILPETTEAPPSYGMSIDSRYISAIAKVSSRLFMLLDIDRVLSDV